MRDYKKEYNNYQGKPEQLKNRATRNNARRQALKAGRVSKGDSKDIDHKVKLIKGGSKYKGSRMRTNMWLLLLFISIVALSVGMLGVQMAQINAKVDKCGCKVGESR
jgi:hypothetical protein